MTLSTWQKKLVAEIKEIQTLIGLDISQIEEYGNKARTPVLKSIFQSYVRNEVISDYVLCDEILNFIIRNHFFDEKTPVNKRKQFMYYVLEKMYLIQKLELVKNFLRVPKTISSNLYALNDIRNGMAHSFLPDLRMKNKPLWKKKSIYRIENFKEYHRDMQQAEDYLLKKAYNVTLATFNFRKH